MRQSRESTLEQLKLQIMAEEEGAAAVAQYKLEQMGFDEATAKSIAENQELLNKPASKQAASLAGQDQRLLMGTAESEQERLFQLTKQNGAATLVALKAAIAELKKIVAKPAAKLDLGVVGD